MYSQYNYNLACPLILCVKLSILMFQSSLHVHAMSIQRNQLSEVFELLYPARTSWYQLGLVLKLSSGTLESMTHHRFSSDCLRKVLVCWLESSGTHDWSGLIQGLRHPMLSRNDLASRIEEYLRPVGEYQGFI